MTPRIGRVSVDAGRCCGYGNCVLVAPALFALSAETNLAYALLESATREQVPALEQAMAECPTEAIRVDV
jgi:ferredoxin